MKIKLEDLTGRCREYPDVTKKIIDALNEGGLSVYEGKRLLNNIEDLITRVSPVDSLEL